MRSTSLSSVTTLFTTIYTSFLLKNRDQHSKTIYVGWYKAVCSTVLGTAGFWGVEPKVNKQHCAHSISDSTWLPFDIRQVSGLLSLILHIWLCKSSNHWKHRFLTEVLDMLSVNCCDYMMTCSLPQDLVDDLPGDRRNPFRIVGFGIGSKTTGHTSKALFPSEDIANVCKNAMPGRKGQKVSDDDESVV